MKKILLLLPLLLLVSCAALPAASDAEPFSYEELAHVFNMTDGDIIDAYGEPDSETVTSYMGLRASEFRYGGNVFRAESTSGYVYYVRRTDDELPAPRGVSVGDRLEDVVARFASTGDEALFEDADGGRFRLLYGDPGSGACGLLWYEGRRPVLLEYRSEGVVMSFGIRGSRVEYMEYKVG